MRTGRNDFRNIEQRAPCPVVGGLDYALRKDAYCGEPVGEHWTARAQRIADLEQPNPGRGAAPGQHVSRPYGPKRLGGELSWTENIPT